MNRHSRNQLGLVLVVLAAGSLRAQPVGQAPVPAPVPTLDELLKLQPKAPEKVPAPAESAVPKPPVPTPLPTAAAAGNPLEEAVALMQDASRRLGQTGTGESAVGISTQRVQQQAIDKLDALISQAKKQQQKKQQKSSSSSGSKGQQQQQQSSSDANQPDQQQSPDGKEGGQEGQDGKQGDAQGKAAGDKSGKAAGDGKSELPGGGAAGASLNPALDAARASWGNLPARVRELLLQGSGEKFSGAYQQLTEDYYRKLGEKPKEGGR